MTETRLLALADELVIDICSIRTKIFDEDSGATLDINSVVFLWLYHVNHAVLIRNGTILQHNITL